MIDPFHAKGMLNLLTKVVSDFEKEFGKINKPKAVEKMEKKMKNMNADKKTISSPTYFG